ncbi:nucleotidyltransferase family protein [Paenibacillus pinihumi]|uniref:nucleotidyltransferase family protein n=1 Tax=Paenibacillus pinihumi TaxID=669462 RepID=UPI0003FDE7BF|nr:nucleotidyltransferase family protein [Paenibacillus pinihumi]
MKLKTEADIIQLVQQDRWMMNILKAAQSLNLPDWWVCAGFVRSKIWDVMHGFNTRTPLPDIDVIYFDPGNLEEATEKQLEQQLRTISPDVPWSVKNEARMHLINHIPPYASSVDAMSKFPETVTALGLALDDLNQPLLAAPHGLADVLDMVVRPTPHFKDNEILAGIYEARISKKNWKSIWHQIEIMPIRPVS